MNLLVDAYHCQVDRLRTRSDDQRGMMIRLVNGGLARDTAISANLDPVEAR